MALSWFNRLLKSQSRPAPRRRRSRLGLEALEDRQLLSLGGAFLVNRGGTGFDQVDSDNATAANGFSVAVYEHVISFTNRDIFIQMFDATGNYRGPEIAFLTGSADTRDPKVAMDDAGNFV